MDLGPLEASDVVREITGSELVNTLAVCLGGAAGEGGLGVDGVGLDGHGVSFG